MRNKKFYKKKRSGLVDLRLPNHSPFVAEATIPTRADKSATDTKNETNMLFTPRLTPKKSGERLRAYSIAQGDVRNFVITELHL